MKKILTIVLVGIFCFILAGCNNSVEEIKDSMDNTKTRAECANEGGVWLDNQCTFPVQDCQNQGCVWIGGSCDCND